MARINITDITIYCSNTIAGIIYEDHFLSFEAAFEVFNKLSKYNDNQQSIYLVVEL